MGPDSGESAAVEVGRYSEGDWFRSTLTAHPARSPILRRQGWRVREVARSSGRYGYTSKHNLGWVRTLEEARAVATKRAAPVGRQREAGA